MSKLLAILALMISVLWATYPVSEAKGTVESKGTISITKEMLAPYQEASDADAEIQRYRSGRRTYRPAPTTPPPTRAVPPRTDTPRRAGGFLGGMGGFLAGAFIGSMLFGGLFGGLGDLSFLGLIIDILVIAVIFMLLRRLWTKMQQRQRH
ncbi:hypothetical protein [Ammoniphilus sp. YIM 78166]|uniref:hypothetical protein n=1 Tax=Ammoniphilus sp. YIM 78166 TaxID=1644106 RepID=UPI0010700597|nr:hypothetical protein [Ammoniphilus sp. YIM 78166]